LFGSLAIALLAATAFVTPDNNANADFGSDCATTCASSNYDYESCMNSCCTGDCAKQEGYGTPGFYSCLELCTVNVCKSNIVNGKYLGCQKSGNPCTFGSATGACGDSPNMTQCSCNDLT
jgi:hypothetical protein